MKKFLTSLLLLSTLYAGAQNSDRPFAIGVLGGLTQYNGDLGQGFYDFGQAAYGHYGVSANLFINPRWDFAANVTNGHLGYWAEDGKRFRGMHIQANAHFRLNILTSDKHKAVPFLHAGIGVSDLHGLTAGPGTDMYVPFGFGLRYQLNQRVNIIAQETFGYTDHDDHDYSVKRTNDAFLLHSVGVIFTLGKVKDSDGDGVTDRNDACPGTPAGAAVDAKGCPLDRDGDGIADLIDKCPDVKGTALANGCPDADGDGITDADDNCPDMKGTPEMKGCPDSDGDGLSDKVDACPNEAGFAALNGCPDKDTDGVADKDDKCPEKAGPASNSGCPVEAPVTTPVTGETQAAAGTVVITQSTTLPIIYFTSGSARIQKAFRPALERVIKALNENTAMKLNVSGHTDNVGKERMNNSLSAKRAEAVKHYLVSKGIAADRLTTESKGYTQPAADNKTERGRGQNRRVEFINQ